MAWVLRNERSGGYWHPDSLQGVTLNRAERAYRFEDRGEAERTADRLNGTLIHGGEAVFKRRVGCLEVQPPSADGRGPRVAIFASGL
jgi:hypothetical protein